MAPIYAAQVVGGPEWLNKDAYNIKGKIPDDIEAAQQTMKRDDRLNQTRAMQQSLLADRFRLKAHYETRVLPVYELKPAKLGLKMYAVPDPPERKPGDPPVHFRSCGPLAPGSSETELNSNGLRVFNGCAIWITALIRSIGPDAGDRPIVNHSGVTVYFDVKDSPGRPWATPEPPAPSRVPPSPWPSKRSSASSSPLARPPSKSSSSTASTAPHPTDGLCIVSYAAAV